MSEIKKIFLGALAAFAVFGLVLTIAPIATHAQQIAPVCGTSCPVIGNPSNIPSGKTGIANFIVTIARFVTFIVGALAVLFLVYGGFLFVTDGGDGKKAGQGKQIFFNAIIGLALAIGAYAVVAVVGNLLQGNVLDGLNT